MSEFFDRLDMFMKIKGLNDNQITVETGISNGIIGKGRKRGGLNYENISKILYTYPELNSNWWFRGVGNMINEDENSEEKTTSLEKLLISHTLIFEQKDEEILKLKKEIQTLKSKVL